MWSRDVPRVLALLAQLLFVSVLGVQQVSNPRIVEHPQDQYVAKNEPATLNCKADGEPPPVITWYRNGELVTTSTTNPQSHRMLLPSGQLFFLRIIHNKNQQPDVGTYYCKATNVETGVSVISRNATLAIASLKEDFREQPANTHVAVGEEARMACQPPRGLPEPSARWKKDGEMIQPGGRLRVEPEGSLVISNARKEDSGVYICIGFNAAGQRESDPARLSVLEKPEFLRLPQDVTVDENNDVVFMCQAKGDPEPTIIWKKENGQIPQGRSQIQMDKSLKIEKVRVTDEGVYICRAENAIGFIEAHVKLIVSAVPSFIVTPRDKTVGIGRRVSFRCEVTGHPAPTVFWNKISKPELMFPRQDNGRFVISDDGTMTIDPVRREDDGEYQCQALSLSGSAIAKARLEVKEMDSRPPPIITQGPQNQTLPLSTVAMLPCAAIGDPIPNIRWLRGGRPVPTTTDPRLAQLDSGTLQISDLKKADSGLYTCVASSETGETTWAAALTVEAPTDSSVIFKRTPEPATFPGPPSKPLASDISDTLIRLTWKTNPNHGASPVQGYIVEFFSHETGEGWRVASDRVPDEFYVVQNLHPGTAYRFLIRAYNSHGLSQPSTVAGPIRTTGVADPKSKHLADSAVARRLASKVVDILPSTVVNSTAIRVHWRLTEDAKVKTREFIEGFHIKYRPTSVQPSIEATETVSDPMATSYLLRNLRKATAYEVRVQPFFGHIEGEDSTAVTAHTSPDVPSAVPHNVVTHMVDNQTMYVSWSPIPQEHHNGQLIGYKIYLYDGEGKLASIMSVNNTAVTSLLIQQIRANVAYRIQMSAYNSAGEGPRTEMAFVGAQHSSSMFQDLLKETWFIATLICGIGGAVWIVLCVLGVWLYKCRHRNKKLKAGGKNALKGDFNRNSRPGYNYNSLHMPGYMHNVSAPGGYANDPANRMSPTDEVKDNWYNSSEMRSNSSTYATANHPAIASYIGQNMDSAFQPIQPSRYILQPTTAAAQARSQQGSGDETVYETGQDYYRDNSAACYSTSDGYAQVPGGGSDYDSQDRQRSVFYLPPPPQHPPPLSEMGTPPRSPTTVGGGWQHASNFTGHPAGNSRSSVRSMACSECEASAYAGLSRCQRCARPISPRQLAEYQQYQQQQQQAYHASVTNSPYIANPDKQQLINDASSQQQMYGSGFHNGVLRAADSRGYSSRTNGVTSESEHTPLRAYKLVPVNGHYSEAEARAAPPDHLVYLHNPMTASMNANQDGNMYDRAIQPALPTMTSNVQQPRPDRSSMATEMSSDQSRRNRRSEVSEDNAYESDMDGHIKHGIIARWVNNQHEGDACSSIRSSTVASVEDEDEEADESYLAAGPDVDFVTAVAAAAHQSGLAVVGSTVAPPGNKVNNDSPQQDADRRVPPPVRAKPTPSHNGIGSFHSKPSSLPLSHNNNSLASSDNGYSSRFDSSSAVVEG